MNKITWRWTIGGMILLVALILHPWVTVDETRQAVITQLGRPVREIKTPGIYFKLPWPVQSAVLFDDRLLSYDTEPAVVITKDKKTLVVDNYVRYRIVNPTLFLQTIRTIQSAQARLDDIVYSELRVQLGQYDLSTIVSEGRNTIMDAVAKASDVKAREYGIEIVDVRIKRTDLPPENEQAVFARMQAERERQAKRYRSEGEEQAQAIRAKADKDKEIILAEAYKKAQLLRGEGDAEAAKIYAAALNEDPEFYRFVRSLDTYKKTLNDTTTLVMSADVDWLKYLKTSR